MNPMYLSIVTVTLNNLHGLQQTLNSIKSQTLCHAELLEWIVIDGGSNDGTVEFLETLALDFSFKWISEKDSGVFEAMNKGVKLSSGRYLIFMNSGDCFASKDVIVKVFDYFSASPVHLISGLVEMYYKSEHKTVDLKPWVCHQSVFIPRALINKYMYDETLKYFGDLDLWKRLYKDCCFNVQRLDLKISKFELGGLGNSPDHIFKRLKERQLVGSRYRDTVPYFFRFIYSIFLYGIYRLAGKDAYYRFLIK